MKSREEKNDKKMKKTHTLSLPLHSLHFRPPPGDGSGRGVGGGVTLYGKGGKEKRPEKVIVGKNTNNMGKDHEQGRFREGSTGWVKLLFCGW